MNLYDGKIRVSQVLAHPKARQLLSREFPDLMNSPLLGMAGHMTLNQVLAMARGKIDDNKIQRLLGELRGL